RWWCAAVRFGSSPFEGLSGPSDDPADTGIAVERAGGELGRRAGRRRGAKDRAPAHRRSAGLRAKLVEPRAEGNALLERHERHERAALQLLGTDAEKLPGGKVRLANHSGAVGDHLRLGGV